MKLHSTNYTNTFIQVADDCPATNGEIPPVKENTRTVANIQFELVSQNPYKYTSNDVLFRVFAKRNNLPENEYREAREKFFSKGQPCFRSSPLTKRYGWGVHSDEDGKIALYGCETPEYQRLSADQSLKVVKAMRSRKS